MITTVADFGLSLQGWAGSGPLSAEALARPREADPPRTKPRCGLFTSTISNGTTPWLDYVRTTEREVAGRHLWFLEPDPAAASVSAVRQGQLLDDGALLVVDRHGLDDEVQVAVRTARSLQA